MKSAKGVIKVTIADLAWPTSHSTALLSEEETKAYVRVLNRLDCNECVGACAYAWVNACLKPTHSLLSVSYLRQYEYACYSRLSNVMAYRSGIIWL